jgi:hypothetical protein
MSGTHCICAHHEKMSLQGGKRTGAPTIKGCQEKQIGASETVSSRRMIRKIPETERQPPRPDLINAMQGARILALARRKAFRRQQDDPARPVINAPRTPTLPVIAGEQP